MLNLTELTLLYDGAIALVVGGVPVYVAATMRAQKRGKGGGPGALGGVLALVWLVVVYGSFIEPQMLVTNSQTIAIGGPVIHAQDVNLNASGAITGTANGTAGSASHTLNIALISDFHLGHYKHREYLAKVVARVNALKPDVVLIAGDLVSSPAGITELGPIKDLQSRLGTYVVLGNWDYVVGAVDVRKAVEALGAEVLTNESVMLDADGAPLALAGLDDVQYGKPDVIAAFTTGEKGGAIAAPAAGTPTILLAHNPDAAPMAEAAGINLVLAGHTHGGQVRLPLLGAVGRIPTMLGQRYDKGLFDIGPTKLFITSGIGESSTRARLFNPPEIAFLRITF